MKKWSLVGAGLLGLGIVVGALGCAPVVQVQTTVLRASPIVGLVLDPTLTVVDVVQGSGTEQAGVQKGDVLKRVNSSKIRPKNAEKMLRKVDTSKDVELTLLRGDKEIKLVVKPGGWGVVGAGGSGPPPTSTPVPNGMLFF